ncbi:MAG: hypothetical protein EPN14_03190 [Gallionella sp.]|nr:MAG: hypothetical protein EPN14_03190 [Gallionella sp.]
MKTEKHLLFAVAGLLSLFSSAAIAGAPLAGQKSDDAAPGMSQSIALEKMIQKNTEQKLAAEAKKYTQMVALAGSQQDELAKRRDEAANAYKTWQSSKSAVELPGNANADGFKAVEVAAQAYSKAHKAFIGLQKEILAKNGVPSGTADTFIAKNGILSDPVAAYNAAPPTAAGSR